MKGVNGCCMRVRRNTEDVRNVKDEYEVLGSSREVELEVEGKSGKRKRERRG